MLKRILSFPFRFRRRDDGGPTIEFVLVFLPFMVLLVSAYELGLMMTRHVMLERGLDMAVREVRLNTGSDLDEQDLRRMICNAAGIIPDCTTTMRLEMRPIDPDNWSNIPRQASCINVSEPFEPARNFNNGADNEIMVLRACGLFRPMLPEFGLGYVLSRSHSDRHYRLVSMSAFVMEPS
jgi:hypothetical protein